MDISTSRHKRCDVVKVEGRIDTYTAPQLQEVLDGLLEEGRYKIVLDMSGVEFLSSKGLWVLTETQKACKRYNRGELVLAEANDKITDSFELVGMGDYFKMYADITSAVGSF